MDAHIHVGDMVLYSIHGQKHYAVGTVVGAPVGRVVTLHPLHSHAIITVYTHLCTLLVHLEQIQEGSNHGHA
jgi:hypothetical protein